MGRSHPSNTLMFYFLLKCVKCIGVELIYISDNLFFKTFSKEVIFNPGSYKKKIIKRRFSRMNLHEMKRSSSIKHLLHYLLHAKSVIFKLKVLFESKRKVLPVNF